MAPAILKLADAYLESLPPEQRPKDRQRIRDSFVTFFFRGFTSFSAGSMYCGVDDAELQGFKTGQVYHRGNPDKIKETFESFGYVATEAEGAWTIRFEHSGFEPRGRNSNREKWWFWIMTDTDSELREALQFCGQGKTIRVTGFLSPKGRYGHLDSYDHEFYATRISKADGG